MLEGDPRLQFVLIEIELGITFATSALIAYKSGHDVHGDSARVDAIMAFESAKRFIGHLDDNGQQTARAELPKLEEALRALRWNI